MKFILSVLIAFSVAGSSHAEPRLPKSEEALAARDEAGRTTIAIRNMADWHTWTASYISRSARLPKDLRMNGPWGDFRVKVKFTVSPEGEVSDVQIEDGSGASRIDTYILDAVRALKLFPFTRDMGEEKLVFVLPINIRNDPLVTPAGPE